MYCCWSWLSPAVSARACLICLSAEGRGLQQTSKLPPRLSVEDFKFSEGASKGIYFKHICSYMRIVRLCTALYYFALLCTTLYYFVLPCITLYDLVLLCTTLYYLYCLLYYFVLLTTYYICIQTFTTHYLPQRACDA